MSRIPVAAFAVASAAPATLAPPPPARYKPMPPPVPSAPERVPAAPEPRTIEAVPGPVPYYAPAETETKPKPSVGSDWTPPLARKNYSWKFRHLELIGLCAWGIPYFATWTLVKDKTGSDLVNGVLAVQVAAYLIAALALACLVHIVQRGDWESVGLKRTERTPLEFALGAGLGFGLIAGFLGVMYLITGHFEMDFATRYMLGGTTGPGAMLGALVLVVGAPVIEEVYFRGMLYDRFARWGIAAAIIGTSLLFVIAHGVGIWDPPRLLVGFALGFARRTKSLWFTIAAHAAWNGAIVFLALFMMTGSAHDFTSADGSFSLRHPAKWERIEEFEQMMPQQASELVLSSPAGSFLAVGSMPAPPNANRWNLKTTIQQVQGAMPQVPGMTMGGFQETHDVPGPFVTSYEARMTISDPMLGRANARMLFVLSDGSPSMVMLVMACPEEDCAKAEPEFQSMLKSLQFSV